MPRAAAAAARRLGAGGVRVPELDPHVRAMALVRLLSSAVELAGALLMIRLNRVESAVQVNALLGLVGPLVLLVATTIGLLGLADRLPPARLAAAVAGVALILLATRSP